MAAPRSSQSAFRHPLSTILIGEGVVRVLRELALHGEPLASRVLADRAKLTIQGVRRILAHLIETGIVAPIGLGRSPSYRLTPHPVAQALAALFAAEAARVDATLEAIRAAARACDPAPLAVWWYGSAARGEDVSGSDLDVAIVVDSDDVEAAVSCVREALAPVEDTQHVALSIVGLSLADLARLDGDDPWRRGVARDGIPLLGPPPEVMWNIAQTRPLDSADRAVQSSPGRRRRRAAPKAKRARR